MVVLEYVGVTIRSQGQPLHDKSILAWSSDTPGSFISHLNLQLLDLQISFQDNCQFDIEASIILIICVSDCAHKLSVTNDVLSCARIDFSCT